MSKQQWGHGFWSGQSEWAKEGVRDAWDYYLSQRPVSMEAMIQVSIEQVFENWLDNNKEEILAAIQNNEALHNRLRDKL